MGPNMTGMGMRPHGMRARMQMLGMIDGRMGSGDEHGHMGGEAGRGWAGKRQHGSKRPRSERMHYAAARRLGLCQAV